MADAAKRCDGLQSASSTDIPHRPCQTSSFILQQELIGMAATCPIHSLFLRPIVAGQNIAKEKSDMCYQTNAWCRCGMTRSPQGLMASLGILLQATLDILLLLDAYPNFIATRGCAWLTIICIPCSLPTLEGFCASSWPPSSSPSSLPGQTTSLSCPTEMSMHSWMGWPGSSQLQTHATACSLTSTQSLTSEPAVTSKHMSRTGLLSARGPSLTKKQH